MGTQGTGRKRIPNRERLSGEDDALNQIAREAEARLAAKRAARAEAREIRMKELERQQKEIYQVQKKYYGLDNKWGDIEQWMEDSEKYSRRARRNTSASDDEERMSVGSRGSLRSDLDSAGAYGGGNHYSSDLYNCSGLSSKPQTSTQNGSRPSMLCSNGLPSRSIRGSLHDDSMFSGSRRFSASSSRAPSEYSGFLGSSSRASSRASSARASPVSFEESDSVAGFLRCAASSSSVLHDLEDVTIPDFSYVEERPERDFVEKGSRSTSTLSAATLASLGGTSSRRGSGDTSISVDTEASIREIKDIHELKDQIQDVESKYMKGLKEVKDSLAEVEEKYRKAMVSNAQLDNEKTNLLFQVDTLKDSLIELEEQLAETRREYEEKSKQYEREKHAHSVLQFQFSEMKKTLQQTEELLAEVRQLHLKQESYVREISDLQETIEWKDKKIGALERQKEYADAIRNERDELREEVVILKDLLKKHGIVPGLEVTANGEAGSIIIDGPAESETVTMEIQDSAQGSQSQDGVIGKHEEVERVDDDKREIMPSPRSEGGTRDSSVDDREMKEESLNKKTQENLLKNEDPSPVISITDKCYDLEDDQEEDQTKCFSPTCSETEGIFIKHSELNPNDLTNDSLPSYVPNVVESTSLLNESTAKEDRMRMHAVNVITGDGDSGDKNYQDVLKSEIGNITDEPNINEKLHKHELFKKVSGGSLQGAVNIHIEGNESFTVNSLYQINQSLNASPDTGLCENKLIQDSDDKSLKLLDKADQRVHLDRELRLEQESVSDGKVTTNEFSDSFQNVGQSVHLCGTKASVGHIQNNNNSDVSEGRNTDSKEFFQKKTENLSSLDPNLNITLDECRNIGQECGKEGVLLLEEPLVLVCFEGLRGTENSVDRFTEDISSKNQNQGPDSIEPEALKLKNTVENIVVKVCLEDEATLKAGNAILASNDDSNIFSDNLAVESDVKYNNDLSNVVKTMATENEDKRLLEQADLTLSIAEDKVNTMCETKQRICFLEEPEVKELVENRENLAESEKSHQIFLEISEKIVKEIITAVCNEFVLETKDYKATGDSNQCKEINAMNGKANKDTHQEKSAYSEVTMQECDDQEDGAQAMKETISCKTNLVIVTNNEEAENQQTILEDDYSQSNEKGDKNNAKDNSQMSPNCEQASPVSYCSEVKVNEDIVCDSYDPGIVDSSQSNLQLEGFENQATSDLKLRAVVKDAMLVSVCGPTEKKDHTEDGSPSKQSEIKIDELQNCEDLTIPVACGYIQEHKNSGEDLKDVVENVSVMTKTKHIVMEICDLASNLEEEKLSLEVNKKDEENIIKEEPSVMKDKVTESNSINELVTKCTSKYGNLTLKDDVEDLKMPYRAEMENHGLDFQRYYSDQPPVNVDISKTNTIEETFDVQSMNEQLKNKEVELSKIIDTSQDDCVAFASSVEKEKQESDLMIQQMFKNDTENKSDHQHLECHSLHEYSHKCCLHNMSEQNQEVVTVPHLKVINTESPVCNQALWSSEKLSLSENISDLTIPAIVKVEASLSSFTDIYKQAPGHDVTLQTSNEEGESTEASNNINDLPIIGKLDSLSMEKESSIELQTECKIDTDESCKMDVQIFTNAENAKHQADDMNIQSNITYVSVEDGETDTLPLYDNLENLEQNVIVIHHPAEEEHLDPESNNQLVQCGEKQELEGKPSPDMYKDYFSDFMDIPEKSEEEIKFSVHVLGREGDKAKDNIALSDSSKEVCETRYSTEPKEVSNLAETGKPLDEVIISDRASSKTAFQSEKDPVDLREENVIGIGPLEHMKKDTSVEGKAVKNINVEEINMGIERDDQDEQEEGDSFQFDDEATVTLENSEVSGHIVEINENSSVFKSNDETEMQDKDREINLEKINDSGSSQQSNTETACVATSPSKEESGTLPELMENDTNNTKSLPEVDNGDGELEELSQIESENKQDSGKQEQAKLNKKSKGKSKEECKLS
ncbi:uncharacterized protein lrrfip1a isoform X7 [Erpetoichthys calabaricus]|uniref:uncharacterized protein lrrfip1a isoform X7 n=1 Tax=Erpetoichthys calabaricus TaxID=27687 RepID=UPI00223489BA|nr:uncharacterized protein lrrfip1a isoform X7 [Erpetoichthys calabaricus]